jgi:hypothetical protein
MQLTPRYLVKNRTLIISNEVGVTTEYRPVYQRELQVYRGIDNVLEFQILNSDQKPIHLNTREVKFVAFDSHRQLVIDRTAEIINANKGLVKVTITDNDVLNVKQQYLHYNVYIVNDDTSQTLTYTDEHFNANAIIYLSSRAFPGPKASIVIEEFFPQGSVDSVYPSEAISAQPGINGNEAIHTAAIYTNGYIGDVIIEATLENQIVGESQVEWTEIARVTLNGEEEYPTPINFTGVLSYVRIVATEDPRDTIEKVLIRN